MAMRSILHDKGGNMEDTFFVMAVIFGMAIFFIILAYTWAQIAPKIDEGLTGAMPSDSPVNVTETIDDTTTITTRYNVYFPLLLVGLFAFVFISAFFIKSHPAFFFIGLIILGVALIMAAIFSNIYHQIAEDDEFATTTYSFPIMDKFMNFLPLIVLLIFAAIGIILWTKYGGATGGL